MQYNTWNWTEAKATCHRQNDFRMRTNQLVNITLFQIFWCYWIVSFLKYAANISLHSDSIQDRHPNSGGILHSSCAGRECCFLWPHKLMFLFNDVYRDLESNTSDFLTCVFGFWKAKKKDTTQQTKSNFGEIQSLTDLPCLILITVLGRVSVHGHLHRDRVLWGQ